jgi:tetratricopeptide (TPR) repeat protein
MSAANAAQPLKNAHFPCAGRDRLYPVATTMKAHRLIPQGSLARLLQSAAEAWNRHDYDQSVEILERANRMAPANPGILLDLGRVHGMRYDYDAAKECFDRAARLAPHKSEALAMAGIHCRDFMRFEMARHYFELATREPKASPDTFAKLAELYERFRLLEEAGEAVDRALQLDPNCALAMLVRTRLDRLTGKLEPAEKLARSFLADSNPNTWSTRIRGWYELGAILDRQGRYDEAMTAFLEAKAMIRPNAGQFIAGQRMAQQRLREAEADISPELLRQWSASAGDPPAARRLAFLCGHPRSGTTLLEQVLDSHPDAISAEETPVFFQTYLGLKHGLPNDARMVSVLEAATPGALENARKFYARSTDLMLGEPAGSRLLIDKNPSLTALVPATVRVLPEASFLVALRDPRDVCLSCFMQPLPLNQVSAVFLNLEDTVGEYASLMGFWRTMAPRLPNPRLEVRYEDMVDDLETVARRVLEFLGLPWEARVLRFNEHARQKLVRSPTYADVAKPVFKGAVGRWRNYQKHLEPWLAKLAPFAKAFGYE